MGAPSKKPFDFLRACVWVIVLASVWWMISPWLLLEQRFSEFKRIQALEGTSGNLNIPYRSRIKFNISQNLDDMAPYLAHRDIPATPAEMTTLDHAVLNLTNSITVKISDQDLAKDYDANQDGFERRLNSVFNQGTDADLSTRAVKASELVYMTHQRPELLHKLLESYNSLRFILCTTSKQIWYGGFDIPGYSINVIKLSSLWYSVDEHHDGWNAVTHETMHFLDDIDPEGSDGLPVLMAASDRNTLTQERIRLFREEEAHPGSSGIDSYAFTNKVEFLAETANIFLEKPVQSFAGFTSTILAFTHRINNPVTKIKVTALLRDDDLTKNYNKGR